MERLIAEQLQRAVDDGGTGNAEVVRDLERHLADLTGAAFALCTSSGTTALISALWAAGVRPGHQVAVPALAPTMTGLAVTAIGARPLFVDCAGPGSFGLGPDIAEQAVRAGATAVVPVPMWGYWDEDPRALAQVRAAGVAIVVDAAQAPFLRLHEDLFAVADAVCLSLHGRKPFKAGEGGALLTADGDLADRALGLRNFGQASTATGRRLDPAGAFAQRLGTNLKINALGAAWCLTQVADADRVRDRFEQLRAAALRALAAAGTPWTEADQAAGVLEHGRYGVVAICPTADHARSLARALESTGVEVDSSRYRYAPMYRAPYFTPFATACPRAEELTARAVAVRLEAFTTTTATEAEGARPCA